jgi:hypothetical protein
MGDTGSDTDVWTIIILISVLLLVVIASFLLRYRSRLCGGQHQHDGPRVPCCTAVIMDLCCIDMNSWGDHYEFQYAMIRRFLTATDLIFGGLLVLVGCVNMGTKTRTVLCAYLIAIGAALMVFEVCSRLFALEAQCRKLFGFMYGPAGRVSFFLIVGAMCVVIDTVGFILGGAGFGLALLNYGIIYQVRSLSCCCFYSFFYTNKFMTPESAESRPL